MQKLKWIWLPFSLALLVMACGGEKTQAPQEKQTTAATTNNQSEGPSEAAPKEAAPKGIQLIGEQPEALPFDYQEKEYTDVFVSSSPGLGKELLKITASNKLMYHSKKYPKGVELQLVAGKWDDMLLEDPKKAPGFSFPSQKTVYKVYRPCGPCGLISINPDGSKQEFKSLWEAEGSRGMFRCKNADGSTEYLYFKNEGKNIYYASDKRQKFEKLISSEEQRTDMGVYYGSTVQFQGKPQKYILSYAGAEGPGNPPAVECKNPDGTIQKFEWLNSLDFKID